MGLRSWLRRLREREDEAALHRAEDMQLESPEERRMSGGDMEGMQVDEQAALAFGDTPEESERLAERDDQ